VTGLLAARTAESSRRVRQLQETLGHQVLNDGSKKKPEWARETHLLMIAANYLLHSPHLLTQSAIVYCEHSGYITSSYATETCLILLLVRRITFKKSFTRCVSRAQNALCCGSAPEPAGGAASAPLPPSCIWGIICGRERREKRIGSKGTGREGRGGARGRSQNCHALVFPTWEILIFRCDY